MKITGVLLVVIGLAMLIYTGFTFKTKEKIIDAGPIEINKEKTHHVNWAPIVGAVVLIAGIAVILTNKNK